MPDEKTSMGGGRWWRWQEWRDAWFLGGSGRHPLRQQSISRAQKDVSSRWRVSKMMLWFANEISIRCWQTIDRKRPFRAIQWMQTIATNCQPISPLQLYRQFFTGSVKSPWSMKLFAFWSLSLRFKGSLNCLPQPVVCYKPGMIAIAGTCPWPSS